MHKSFIIGTGLLAATVCLIAATPQATRTYTGDIMDSACAAQHGHAAMMKKEGAPDAKACTLACVKNGATLVLYNASTRRTFKLDDQTKANDFAGDNVKVTGTYDPAAGTIKVTDITRAN